MTTYRIKVSLSEDEIVLLEKIIHTNISGLNPIQEVEFKKLGQYVDLSFPIDGFYHLKNGKYNFLRISCEYYIEEHIKNYPNVPIDNEIFNLNTKLLESSKGENLIMTSSNNFDGMSYVNLKDEEVIELNYPLDDEKDV